ncbi:MAG: hypothetical protein E5V49_00875 [Mesorhizobium sp.]|nr:hypothetical protein EN848_22660 [bacterium M00.F.Ca.ET.205.01.1.1]TGU49387.1 hypothetical protein EN795_23940 [bacterium M00.F.Ca.ET.152.01.1.1]TGV33485.1 hypothetical protein EN829_021895 [Mesorhizobium sp. M00.F.Ca.ET.186.01.1.1]TGZ40389.1 hypothetical protein EN805_23335 [bacterium M00.F.Ca.ET.162.01.1.1]TIW63128.1 MAG: hypothetical protein E5V48_01265 [Mesorhizobium sp.]
MTAVRRLSDQTPHLGGKGQGRRLVDRATGRSRIFASGLRNAWAAVGAAVDKSGALRLPNDVGNTVWRITSANP